MADASTDGTKKAKPPGTWGGGFLIAAAIFFVIVDESDPESVASLPAVVSLVVLVAGKAGLVGGCVALGVGLTVWELHVKSGKGRAEQEERAERKERAAVGPRPPAPCAPP